MATLIFTAVGSAIGGPVGGLIGSVLGQRIDDAIFTPGGRREGPRLQELAVQTSSYGTQIPGLFGAVRAAGSVIWATDLKEKRNSTSGGKGRPSTVRYSYSVSLAIALSSRPLLRVGRIWADGNLLRGADGSFKVATGFRFHAGHNDQQPDPLIASVESSGGAPAFRGIAYAVFENLELADYGNRIPSLTFELFERDGSVSIAEICRLSTDGLLNGNVSDSVVGYAVLGPSARAALGTMLDLSLLQCRPAGDRLELFRPEEAGHFAGDSRHIVTGNAEHSRGPSAYRSADRNQPYAVTLRYYDPARDYQAGVQRSGWSVSGELDEQLELPAVLDTALAQAMARNRANWRRASRDRRQSRVATGAEQLQLGQALGTPAMRVTAIEHYAGYAEIECERMASVHASASAPVDGGRHTPSPDETPGETLLAVAELPSLGPSAAIAPVIAIAAGGTGTGWRRAAISRRIDGEVIDLGLIELPCAIGSLVTPLALHDAQLVDVENSVEIRIDSNAQPPVFGSANPFAIDAPFVMVGPELIRCGTVEPIGDNRYRIGLLMRGCSATPTSAHPAGTRLFFPDKDRLLLPELPASAFGAIFAIEAAGLGDEQPVAEQLTIAALATTPLAPVHGRSEVVGDGSLALSWIRRSRHDPGWIDGVDVPLVEAALRYDVVVEWEGAPLFTAETDIEHLVIDVATMVAWPVPSGGKVTVRVRQFGDYGISPALTFDAQL